MKYAFAAISVCCSATIAHAGLNDKLPPEAYRSPIDQQIARTGKGIPGRPYPCSYSHIENGQEVIESQPTELCVKMQPQQRWRGLWRDDFEGSRFCPAPARECTHDSPGEQIWLSETPGRPDGGLYRVEFIGRKTMYKGPYGHMGVFDQEITIDRPISIELIEDRKK